MVNQGDLLHGDVNGVTNIPLDIATEMAEITPEFVAAEQIVLDYVQGLRRQDAGRPGRRPQGVLRRGG